MSTTTEIRFTMPVLKSLMKLWAWMKPWKRQAKPKRPNAYARPLPMEPLPVEYHSSRACTSIGVAICDALIQNSRKPVMYTVARKVAKTALMREGLGKPSWRSHSASKRAKSALVVEDAGRELKCSSFRGPAFAKDTRSPTHSHSSRESQPALSRPCGGFSSSTCDHTVEHLSSTSLLVTVAERILLTLRIERSFLINALDGR